MAKNKKQKTMKVVFAPGCFDSFEGTQEELDELLDHINKTFDGKTAEEIEAMSNPVDWDNLDPEEQELLEKQLNNNRDIKH